MRTDEVIRVDIDLVDVVEEICRDVALPEDTEVVRTPRGGLHIALRATNPAATRSLYLQDDRRLGDLKAAGGYVLVPPSRIGDRQYVCLSPEPGILLAVDDPRLWLAKLLPEFGFALADERMARVRDYRALAGTIHAGEGRHNALISYAGRVWVEGMEAETLAGLLSVVNEHQCSPPLLESEVREIADHFVTKREPRAATSPNGHPCTW